MRNNWWKDHYLVVPLSNLYCFTMKASNTEAKLTHQQIQKKRSFHFAMHSTAECKQRASFVNFQFISNSAIENVTEILPRIMTVPSISSYCIVGWTVTDISENTTEGVFLQRKKRTLVTRVLKRFYLCSLLFPCLLVNTLLEDCLGWSGGVYLTIQWNMVGVCITCAGMETVWKDPTAPQTCKHSIPLVTAKEATPGLQCSGNNSTVYPAMGIWFIDWVNG